MLRLQKLLRSSVIRASSRLMRQLRWHGEFKSNKINKHEMSSTNDIFLNTASVKTMKKQKFVMVISTYIRMPSMK